MNLTRKLTNGGLITTRSKLIFPLESSIYFHAAVTAHLRKRMKIKKTIAPPRSANVLEARYLCRFEVSLPCFLTSSGDAIFQLLSFNGPVLTVPGLTTAAQEDVTTIRLTVELLDDDFLKDDDSIHVGTYPFLATDSSIPTVPLTAGPMSSVEGTRLLNLVNKHRRDRPDH